MKRILFLPKYGRKAASTRHRFLQFFPALEASGALLEVSPLLDDGYMESLAKGRRAWLPAFLGYLRRLAVLLRARRYDLVVLNYEAMPYLPAFFERALGWLGVPYVVDLDDAIFHQYDRGLAAFLLAGKIGRVMSGARLVIAGNEYLAGHARRYNSRVAVVPTVVDTAQYRPAVGSPVLPVIGWIGSPSTAAYLAEVARPLEEAAAAVGGRIVLVGAGPAAPAGLSAELREWSEESEVREIQGFTVGVMPLHDDPWSRGKCGFKLIQYLACGVPVVASPVGVNATIASEGGLLARDAEEWKAALLRLLGDPALRARLAAAGRAQMEREFSLSAWRNRWVELVLGAI